MAPSASSSFLGNASLTDDIFPLGRHRRPRAQSVQ
jgi:hypothetical protein